MAAARSRLTGAVDFTHSTRTGRGKNLAGAQAVSRSAANYFRPSRR